MSVENTIKRIAEKKHIPDSLAETYLNMSSKLGLEGQLEESAAILKTLFTRVVGEKKCEVFGCILSLGGRLGEYDICMAMDYVMWCMKNEPSVMCGSTQKLSDSILSKAKAARNALSKTIGE